MAEGINEGPPQQSVPISSEPDNTVTPIGQKLQEITNVRERAAKEINRARRTYVDEPNIVIDDLEEQPQNYTELTSTLEEKQSSDGIQSKDALGIRRALKDIVDSDIGRLNDEINAIEAELTRIHDILMGEPYRYFSGDSEFEQPFNLNKKQEKQFQRLKEAKEKAIARRKELTDHRHERYSDREDLSHDQKRDFENTCSEQITTLAGEYQELLTMVISDKSIVHEVLQSYISSTIEPQINELVQDLSYKEPEISKKVEKLREAIGKIQSGAFLENNARKKLLDEFITDYDFRPLSDDLSLLQTGEEYRIINRLITTFFQQDLDEIKPKDDNFRYDSHLSSIFDVYSYTSSEPDISPWGNEEPINFVSHFGTMYYRTLSSPKEEHYSDIGNINNRLVAIMRSSSTYGLFKEKVDNLYKKNHEFLLEKSLTDSGGSYIDQLIHFPEPETVRNLVLISSARFENYRTEHALHTLKRLTQQKDWPDLLRRALEEYPELSSAEVVLRNFNPDFNIGHVIYPELSSNSQEFALGMIQKFPENKDLISIAFEIIDGTTAVNLLHQKGMITQNEVRDLHEALKLIRQNDENPEGYGSYYYLSQKVAEVCKDLYLFEEKDNMLRNESKKQLSMDSLIKYSRIITEFQNISNSTILLRDIQNDPELMESILRIVVNREIKKIDTLFTSETQIEVDENNWESLLLTYIKTQTQNYNYISLSESSTEKIKILFSDPKIRNICLNGFQNLWTSYLESGNPDEIPFSLITITEFIKNSQGAGPLSQIQSLSSFIDNLINTFNKEAVNRESKLQAMKLLLEVEQRFNKDRFSNDDRTEFYNISSDFLNIDLELFSNTLLIIKELSPPQLKLFLREIYPLYRVRLILNSGNISSLKIHIRNFSDSINSGQSSFEAHKQVLIDEIKTTFKDSMGIIKIPDELTEEHLRSIKNISLYIANINDRNPEKEVILSFYLSLILNEKWNDFISGIDINPEDLLISEKSRIIQAFLDERKEANPLNPKKLGLSQEEMPAFFRILQREEEKIVVGNIETVDIKLGNVIINLQGLVDLDLYNLPLDKQRMEILMRWGNKSINSTIAKMYQSLENSDRVIQFSDEENQIQQQILKIIQENGLSLTPQILKQYFQDEMRPFAAIVNLLAYINETNAQPEIEKLRQLLHPSQEIIEVFQKLGEDFKPTSGAMALSQDLNYLTNLIVKREAELKPEEIDLLRDYISKIREQVVLLEEVYNKIKDKFTSLRQGMISRENPILEEKFNQISAIISAQTTQQTVTSTMTHNLNTIIENIRECLSCSEGGSNNDTNLTFGDSNKFFVTSQSETQKSGSIADQIIFVEPVMRTDGSQEISFVLDRIYGTNTPIILENHVDVILSKVRQIKKRFPSLKLSILITDSALSSSGTSSDIFLTNLTNKSVSATSETVKVDILRSVFGDHYIEFGGSARAAGTREVNGIIISV